MTHLETIHRKQIDTVVGDRHLKGVTDSLFWKK